MDAAEKRGALMKLVEDALALADQTEDDKAGYLIERRSTKHELNNSDLAAHNKR